MLDEKEIKIEDEGVMTRGIQCKLTSITQKEYFWEHFFIPDGYACCQCNTFSFLNLL